MYPALCEGDALTVCYYQKPLLLSQIPIGKVVLLKDKKEWVVHRVVLANQKHMTKGDWSYPLDSMEEVWGEVVAINGRKSAVLESPLIAKISVNRQRSFREISRSTSEANLSPQSS